MKKWKFEKDETTDHIIKRLSLLMEDGKYYNYDNAVVLADIVGSLVYRVKELELSINELIYSFRKYGRF